MHHFTLYTAEKSLLANALSENITQVVDPRPKPEETDELDVKLADLPPPSFVNVRTDAEAKDDAEPEGTAKEERQRCASHETFAV